jgi:hypothetical protein
MGNYMMIPAIGYFAKHEFYLADLVKSLEIQLDICIELLDLMMAGTPGNG